MQKRIYLILAIAPMIACTAGESCYCDYFPSNVEVIGGTPYPPIFGFNAGSVFNNFSTPPGNHYDTCSSAAFGGRSDDCGGSSNAPAVYPFTYANYLACVNCCTCCCGASGNSPTNVAGTCPPSSTTSTTTTTATKTTTTTTTITITTTTATTTKAPCW